MDERIDESLIDNSRPFFGTLKWTYHNYAKQKAINFIAVSGIYYSKEHYFITTKYDIDLKIENIILETVDKKTVNSLNISALLVDLQTIVDQLETILTKQFTENNNQLLDWKSKFDIVMILEQDNSA
ncbi:MAG: hypothetical protein Q8L90_12755 [Bacteroidota bacterium]|nr:hypothetical protein [Bacteroidota bacterium]